MTHTKPKRSPTFPPTPQFHGSFDLEVVPTGVCPHPTSRLLLPGVLLLLLPGASFMLSWIGFPVCLAKGGAAPARGRAVFAPAGAGAALLCFSWAWSSRSPRGNRSVPLCFAFGSWFGEFFSSLQVEQVKRAEFRIWKIVLPVSLLVTWNSKSSPP